LSALNIVCPHCFVTNRLPDNKLQNNPKCGKCGDAVFDAKPVSVNEEQFGKMLKFTDIPIVIDFWAEWCGPCKTFAPIYVQAAERLEPKVRLLKVDTEQNQSLASSFRIQSIPTLAIFSGGKEITRQSGAMPLSSFVDWVTSQT
jgi:thioredoxin 2